MITVKTYNNRVEAELAVQTLEQAGIKAFLFIDDQGGLHPSMALASGAEVKVVEQDYEEALKILEEDSSN